MHAPSPTYLVVVAWRLQEKPRISHAITTSVRQSAKTLQSICSALAQMPIVDYSKGVASRRMRLRHTARPHIFRHHLLLQTAAVRVDELQYKACLPFFLFPCITPTSLFHDLLLSKASCSNFSFVSHVQLPPLTPPTANLAVAKTSSNLSANYETFGRCFQHHGTK